MRAVPSCVAIIPARWASSRFPGKPLATLLGKPMIQHVVERVHGSGVFDVVRVATDDERIEKALRERHIDVVRSRADHATGTDRVAEVTRDLAADSLVFNVQGDEPLIEPGLLVELVALLRDTADAEMVTAAHPEDSQQAHTSPHVVKVVCDHRGRALYFSRASIPHATAETSLAFLRHVGVYGFRQSTLQRFVTLPTSTLEAQEGLEQLRALENGIPIHVHRTRYRSVGVDTPEDLAAVERLLRETAGPLQPTRRG
jgi:3-deoxy-manno-octulosonate cytidylyltransferase (CMP-KDO synthetase)